MHHLSSLPSSTLHRLLEAQGENRYRRNRILPLVVDLLVVDEVSMVDLPLMEALLEASSRASIKGRSTMETSSTTSRSTTSGRMRLRR